jgi:4-methoxybenzoate monooxygenase (O-demethylating)
VTTPSLALDPFAEAFLANPYAHHEALREAGPLCWLPAINAFGIARYGEVKAVLEDPATFVSGRGVGLADFAKVLGGPHRYSLRLTPHCMIAHAG